MGEPGQGCSLGSGRDYGDEDRACGWNEADTLKQKEMRAAELKKYIDSRGGGKAPEALTPVQLEGVRSITTQAQYDVIVRNLLDRSREIEDAKRPDYTVNNIDVLKNFKASGEEAGISAEQAWIIFAKKHWDAIRAIMQNPEREFSEPPRERFCDLINYLKLGYALYKEKHP